MKRKTSTRICIILSLVSAALLMPASCGDGGERVFLVKPKVYKAAPAADTLSSTRIIQGDTLILSVDDVMFFNDMFIIQSLETSTSVFNLFDLNGRMVSHFGNIGRAENEFSEGASLYGQYDSRHIYVNDVNAAAIKFIDIPASAEQGRCIVTGKIPTTERVINAVVLDDSSLVYEQMSADNFRLNIRPANEPDPTMQIDLYVPSDDPFGTYRSFMRVNLSKRIVALAMNRMNQINFISLDNGKRASSSLYEPPVLPDERQMRYYCNITASRNYVYALYMNQTYDDSYEVEKPMEIHVFDWSGRHIRTYATREYIWRISVSPDDRTLIACDMDNSVLKYSL